jgi:ABC-type branched-subunit amino acid transport system substrate-binding protein
MNKNTWWVVGVVIVAAVVVFFGFRMGRKPVSQVGTIKIGSMLSMSGDFAQFGEAINQGALLAVDVAKSKGIDVQYSNQDDQSSAVGAANAANTRIKFNSLEPI